MHLLLGQNYANGLVAPSNRPHHENINPLEHLKVCGTRYPHQVRSTGVLRSVRLAC